MEFPCQLIKLVQTNADEHLELFDTSQIACLSCVGGDKSFVNGLAKGISYFATFKDTQHLVNGSWLPCAIQIAMDVDVANVVYPMHFVVSNYHGPTAVRYILEKNKPIHTVYHVIGGPSIHVPHLII